MATKTDFSVLTQQLIMAIERSPARGLALCQKILPDLVQQIQQDSRHRGPLSFWGRSQNVDEVTETTIVHPHIVNLISAIAGRKMSTRTPHAGLQHTYGYLFSTIHTPYGYKRDRWIETQIESAFQLNETTLGPTPHAGTLLSNVTWLCGQVAFRGFTKHLSQLEKFLHEKVADDLSSTNLRGFAQQRLSETVSTDWRGRSRKFTLQTDLLTSSTDDRLSLKIYSVINHTADTHQLITLFPVGPASLKEITGRATQERRNDIQLRYNASIPALNGRVLSGACRVKEFRTESPRGKQAR